MKAVILARVSTKEQEDQGHSLPAQIRKLKEYAGKHSFKVVEEFSFSESAGSKIRKKFEEVLKYLKQHKDVKVLLCENVDRLTRNFKDAVDIDEMRKNNGLEVHFVQDGFFINAQATGNQMFMWEAKVFLAKQYLNRLSDDVNRSIEEKLEKLEWPERAPIGYKNITTDNERKDIIIDPERGYHIKKAFELYATGSYSVPQIAKIIEADGLRNRSPYNSVVPYSQLDLILKNPFYYGEFIYRGEVWSHRYEPLIEKWLFEKCNSVRNGRSNTLIKYASKPFAFRGLIRCAACDCMVGKDPKKGINYCICNQFKGKHGAERVTEEDLIDQVKVVFANIKVPDDVIEDTKKDQEKTFQAEQEFFETSIEQNRKEYDENKKILKKAYLDNARGRITDSQYDEIVEELSDRQDFLNNQTQKHTEANKEFMIGSSYLLRLSQKALEIFESSKPEQKRRLIAFVLSNLKLEGKKLSFTLNEPFDAIVKCSKSGSWLPGSDSNGRPTPYTDLLIT